MWYIEAEYRFNFLYPQARMPFGNRENVKLLNENLRYTIATRADCPYLLM